MRQLTYMLFFVFLVVLLVKAAFANPMEKQSEIELICYTGFSIQRASYTPDHLVILEDVRKYAMVWDDGSEEYYPMGLCSLIRYKDGGDGTDH